MSDESFLRIDLNRLEQQWAEQPELYRDWAKMLAEAKKELRELENEEKVVEAKASKAVRRNPSKYDIEKGTEPEIKAAITLHPKVLAIKQKIIDAHYTVDQLEGMVKALDHRKKALENEVILHGQSYYATPYVGSEFGDAITSSAKQAKRKERAERFQNRPKKRGRSSEE